MGLPGWGRRCPPTRGLRTRWTSRRKEAAGWGRAEPGGIPGGNGLDREGGGSARSRGDPHALPQPPQEPGRAMGTLQDTVSDAGERGTQGVPRDRWPRAGGLFCPGAFGGAMCLGVPGVLFVWGGWSSPFPVSPCPAGSGTPKSSAVYSILQPDLGVGVLGRREPPQHPQQDPALSPPPSLHQLHILGRWKLHPSMWVGKHLVLPAPAPSSTPKFGEGMT